MKHGCDKCGKDVPDVLRLRVMKIFFGTGALLGTMGLCMDCYGKLVNDFIRAPGPKEIAEHMEMRHNGGV